MINVRSAISKLTLTGAAGLIAAALVVPQPALAQLEKPSVKFSQSWLFQAAQAMFPLAADRGYWRTEGLDVTIDRGSGSTAAVQRASAHLEGRNLLGGRQAVDGPLGDLQVLGDPDR